MAKTKKPRLGSGGRFRKGVLEIMASGKSKQNAKAIMAAAGRKKYGKSGFQALSAAGRRRAAKKGSD
jgi:hypothetical protein